MRSKNSQKLVNKKEELPSFLLGLEGVPEGIDIPPRNKKSASYLGPIFFGECLQFHPPHHSVPLSSFHHVQFSLPPKENVLKDVFQPKFVAVKTYYEPQAFHPAIRTQKVFVDSYAHKCPGVRKIFAPDPSLSKSLGETKSIIEGETSREIPFCRLKQVPSGCGAMPPEPELEIVTLSDIREEKRGYMSYKERIAHAHFPKEFVTVRVIGPTIPEAITITKLPCKRKTSFEIDLHLKTKTKKGAKKGEKEKESPRGATAAVKKEREEQNDSVPSILRITETSVEERFGSGSERKQSEEIEEENDRQQSEVIRDDADEEQEEVEALEEVEEAGEDNSQVFISKEKEDSLGTVQVENQNEADDEVI